MSRTAEPSEFVPYKQLKSKADRIQESSQILEQHGAMPRVPVIVERSKNEKFLPILPKRKFLVPLEQTLQQLHSTVRFRLNLNDNQGLFLLVSGKHMPAFSSSLADIYEAHKDEDGFLYINYASQEVYG